MGQREKGGGWRRLVIHKGCNTSMSNNSVFRPLHLLCEVQLQAGRLEIR